MRFDIEVRSSGPGPRLRLFGDGEVVLVLDIGTNWTERKWPRDGVAVIIRRAA